MLNKTGPSNKMKTNKLTHFWLETVNLFVFHYSFKSELLESEASPLVMTSWFFSKNNYSENTKANKGPEIAIFTACFREFFLWSFRGSGRRFCRCLWRSTRCRCLLDWDWNHSIWLYISKAEIAKTFIARSSEITNVLGIRSKEIFSSISSQEA